MAGGPALKRRRTAEPAQASLRTFFAGPSNPTPAVEQQQQQQPRQAECPVCGRQVPLRTIEVHVDRCLDGQTDKLEPSPPHVEQDHQDRHALETVPDEAPPLEPKQEKEQQQQQWKPMPLDVSNQPKPEPEPEHGPATDSNTNSAFSKLMESHTESKQWAAADAAESLPRSRTSRPAPFYKILEGMPLSVDAFRFGSVPNCQGYFLTHFHSDHYGGLAASWSHGPIFCSVATANLCRIRLGVDQKWLVPLPMEVPTQVPGGVTVTLIEANHCPGSCLFLFEGLVRGKQVRYLHCGDFRASPRQVNHPAIRAGKIDIIYLDTTYLNPRYCFPAQEQVVDACASLVLAHVQSETGSSTKREEGRQEPEAAWQSSASARALRGWLGRSSSSSSLSPTSEQELKVEESGLAELQDAGDQHEIKFQDDRDPDADQECEWEEDAAATAAAAQVCIKKEEKEEEEQYDELKGLDLEAEGDFFFDDDQDAKLETDAKVEDLDADGLALVKAEEQDTKVGLSGGRLLVVIGTYTIGKEKLVKAVARALNTRVFCVDSRKYRVYASLEDSELDALLTRNPIEAAVHVTSLFAITGTGLRDMLAALRARGARFDRAIGFRPTGWTYRPPTGADTTAPDLARLIAWNQTRRFTRANLYPTRDSTPDAMVYGVPYSEHSSFFELTAFALGVRYDRIIATVNVGSPSSRAKMAKWFEKWRAEKRRREKAGLRVEVVPRADNYW